LINNPSKYYWKGIVDGENQEGEILAQSKEDATSQLKDKKVIITQLNL
jgi:type II secretory pathway component PulF